MSACFAHTALQIFFCVKSFNSGPPAHSNYFRMAELESQKSNESEVAKTVVVLAAVASVIRVMASLQVPVSAAAGPAASLCARTARGARAGRPTSAGR